MASPSAGMRATFAAHSSVRSATLAPSHTSVKMPRCSIDAGLDGVAGQQQTPREHRAEPVEEEMEVAERGAEQPRAGHADLRVATDDEMSDMSASSKPPPSA